MNFIIKTDSGKSENNSASAEKNLKIMNLVSHEKYQIIEFMTAK